MDFTLINLVRPRDVVVTKDSCLATMGLTAECAILAKDNTNSHLPAAIRNTGNRLKGPVKRVAQDKAFSEAFIKLM